MRAPLPTLRRCTLSVSQSLWLLSLPLLGCSWQARWHVHGNARSRCTMLVCDAQCAAHGALMRDALTRDMFIRGTRRSATSNAWCVTSAVRGADA
jgi:uncharacterized membrane protein